MFPDHHFVTFLFLSLRLSFLYHFFHYSSFFFFFFFFFSLPTFISLYLFTCSLQGTHHLPYHLLSVSLSYYLSSSFSLQLYDFSKFRIPANFSHGKVTCLVCLG
ncbi:hypothetical protein BO99DRAFT_98251 [Aspergillus violaceofuscus CBS 115571]|uniref:Uncharacterized protein n=1 Tax=Aspergillus violaceofuscus (strain CBS 115571) TaxID=1450538 RepID=A0A2V5HBW5_ASPV1|nr:hypothetical protein BO99DRAFT_98251 [Aspergillus violaceofuscus CBS 115571]